MTLPVRFQIQGVVDAKALSRPRGVARPYVGGGPAGGTDTSIPLDPLTVTDVNGLWIADRSYVTETSDRVAVWQDLSGTEDMAQVNAARQPLFVDTGTDGRAVVHIDAIDRGMIHAARTVRHMFFVERTGPTQAGALLRWPNTSGTPRIAESGAITCDAVGGSFEGTDFASGAIYPGLQTYGLAEFRYPGVRALNLGGYFGWPGQFGMTREVAAIVLSSEILTGADLNTIRTWANTHFGTAA